MGGRSVRSWVCWAAAIAAVFSACSKGLPSNFATYRGEGFSIGYPRAWNGCHGQLPFAGTEEPAAEFSGPAGKGQIVPPVVQVADEGTKRTFQHALNFHKLLLQVNPGYKELGEDGVKVPGAKTAVPVEFQGAYPDPVAQGQPEIHGMNLVAEAPNGSVVSLLISATTADFERLKETFDDVLRSLALGSEVDQSGSANLPDCSTRTQTPSPSPSA